MGCKYVSDFTFGPSPARPTIKGYARGGHVSTTKTYASGGSVNPGDAKSPGSFKRSPPKTSSMLGAAKNTFAAKTAPPATKQNGDVERMAGWSDFKKGGSTKPAFNRLQNLGHYAHGGAVKKANGGLTRGVSARKNAAIHVKSHRPSIKSMGAGMAPSPMIPGGGGIGALAGLSGGQGPMSAPPPGLPPGGAPGAPPAMRRGGRA